MKRFIRKSLQTGLAAILLAAFAVPAAVADQVKNDVTGTPTLNANNTLSVGYKIVAQKDSNSELRPYCNVSSSNPATISPILPLGVQADPGSVTISECDNAVVPPAQHITYTFQANTSTTEDKSYDIPVTVTQSGKTYAGEGLAGDPYNPSPAKIRVIVVKAAPPTCNAGYHLDTSNNTCVADAPTLTPDITAPTVMCDPAAAAINWRPDNASFACTAFDPTVNGAVTSGLANDGDKSFSLSTNVADGSETADAATDSRPVADIAGNTSTAGPIGGNKIDRKAPQLAGCDSASGLWSAIDVTLSCTYTDGGSGPALQSISLRTSVPNGTETANAFASANGAQAVDAVGNKAASPADIGGNKIDKKPPTSSPTGLAISYVIGSSPAAPTCPAIDAGSGRKADGTLSGFSTAAVGTFTASCNDATDIAGNTQTQAGTAQYIVTYAICNANENLTKKTGSTYPVKLQVCNARGVNLGNVGTVNAGQVAIQLTSLDVTAAEDAGTSNPDFNFRYDSTANQYIYNLQLKDKATGANLAAGNYQLKYTIANDPGPHVFKFTVGK